MKYSLPPHVSSATPLGHFEFVANEHGHVDVPDGTPPEVIQALVDHCGAVQLPAEQQEQLEAPGATPNTAMTDSGRESDQGENESETPDSERAALMAQLEALGGKADKRASIARLRDQVGRLQGE